MSSGETPPVPISALQHYVYCDRQCALIHVEGQWVENRLTAEGQVMHARPDSGPAESRGELVVARGLRLRSGRLGLVGRADVVEFRRTGGDLGVVLPRRRGRWRPRPVEYKRGRPKPVRCDEVQLCAQALCLEEMLRVTIPSGVLLYGRTRRRKVVDFGEALRRRTEEVAVEVHRLLARGETPPADWAPKCRRCSLLGVCLPPRTARSARAYLEEVVRS